LLRLRCGWRCATTGTQCVYACPPGFPLTGTIWGTTIYTDDSAVCKAAMHAGLISQAAGGSVTIAIADGQQSYAATTQNGVTSSGWSTWGRSFVFVGAGGAGGGGGGGTGGPCDNPKTLQFMDQWLNQAIPVMEGNLHYEPWGRVVGTTDTTVITAPNKPDTTLTRCEYLLESARFLTSRNLGTLLEYLQKNGVL
jgi:hypothetical protein